MSFPRFRIRTLTLAVLLMACVLGWGAGFLRGAQWAYALFAGVILVSLVVAAGAAAVDFLNAAIEGGAPRHETEQDREEGC